MGGNFAHRGCWRRQIGTGAKRGTRREALGKRNANAEGRRGAEAAERKRGREDAEEKERGRSRFGGGRRDACPTRLGRLRSFRGIEVSGHLGLECVGEAAAAAIPSVTTCPHLSQPRSPPRSTGSSGCADARSGLLSCLS